MNGYYDIHCPYCGSVISPMDIKFSISEFVGEIFDQRLDEKFNDGILGVIDSEEINLILDNDFLWDLSVNDIQACYRGDMFVLAGESLIARFGPRALEMYRSITKSAIEDITQSSNIADAMNQNGQARALVEEILKNVSQERLMRTEVQTEDRDAAVLNLIRYAKTEKILFKIHIKVEADKDDLGNIINKDIRSKDERIICKSKRCCNCGNELSKLSGKYEEKVISFIGSPAAGKSAYLAAAINKLLNSGQTEYGIEVIFDYQSSDYIAFNESCLYPYSKGFAITKTNQGTFPQLSMALKNSSTGKTYLYTFVDIPGETFIDEGGCNIGDLLANRRIIKHADVIWYCVSAKQLFASNVGISVRPKDGTIENEEMKDLSILGQNTIRFASEMYADGTKKPAVALILTKSDLLSEYVMETIFSGDDAKNRAIKREYFKTICSAPSQKYGNTDEDYDYYDGEPNTLGYIYQNKLNFQKFMNSTKNIADFIKNYGEPYSEVFMGNIATAFDKKSCPCFSQASYGRTVERFSVDTAVRYLMANKERISPRDYEGLVSIFGESELEAFVNGEGKLPVIKERDRVTDIQNLYKRLNPVFPFGIMSVLEWTFAYTGFVECVQNFGDQWVTIPITGDKFAQLQSRLTLESEGSIDLGFHREPVKEEPTGFWGKLFGKKN